MLVIPELGNGEKHSRTPFVLIRRIRETTEGFSCWLEIRLSLVRFGRRSGVEETRIVHDSAQRHNNQTQAFVIGGRFARELWHGGNWPVGRTWIPCLTRGVRSARVRILQASKNHKRHTVAAVIVSGDAIEGTGHGYEAIVEFTE